MALLNYDLTQMIVSKKAHSISNLDSLAVLGQGQGCGSKQWVAQKWKSDAQ